MDIRKAVIQKGNANTSEIILDSMIWSGLKERQIRIIEM